MLPKCLAGRSTVPISGLPGLLIAQGQLVQHPSKGFSSGSG